MKRKTLFSFLALGAMFFNVPSVNVKATENLTYENLVATADTFVRAGNYADLNYGAVKTLIVQGRATIDNNYYETYLKFSVTAGVKVLDEAKLELTYHSVSTDIVGRGFNVYITDSNWLEGTGNASGVDADTSEGRLTYNNASTYAETDDSNYVTYVVSGDAPVAGDVLSIDVTTMVNEYLKVNSDGNNATNISFRIASNRQVGEKELRFRGRDHTSGGGANLAIAYDPDGQKDAVNVETEISDLDTTAQLNFDYTYTGSSTSNETSIVVDSTKADYVTEGEDFSSWLGLDSNVFNVTAKSNGANNTPRVYNGYVRMYNNNSLTLKAINTDTAISNISFEVSNSQLTVLDINENVIESNDGKYIVNGSSVTLKNSSGTALNITSLTINYETSNIEYNTFSNVCMKFKATIPSVYFENISSYGIKIKVNDTEKDVSINKYSEKENMRSFALVINNIDNYDVEITATAYVVIGNNVIDLKSKTYSVKTIVSDYILRATELNLSAEQVRALNGFNSFLNAE